MVQVINSCEEYFSTLNDRFVADKAKGVTATYLYDLDGDTGGKWTVVLEDGALSVKPGEVENPSVTYQMKADDYVKLANGEINGMKAVMTRKLKVTGSIILAKKMNKFLPPRS